MRLWACFQGRSWLAHDVSSIYWLDVRGRTRINYLLFRANSWLPQFNGKDWGNLLQEIEIERALNVFPDIENGFIQILQCRVEIAISRKVSAWQIYSAIRRDDVNTLAPTENSLRRRKHFWDCCELRIPGNDMFWRKFLTLWNTSQRRYWRMIGFKTEEACTADSDREIRKAFDFLWTLAQPTKPDMTLVTSLNVRALPYVPVQDDPFSNCEIEDVLDVPNGSASSGDYPIDGQTLQSHGQDPAFEILTTALVLILLHRLTITQPVPCCILKKPYLPWTDFHVR